MIEELVRSAKRDRQLTVRMLAELGEVRARGLYRDLGFSTMYDYATRKLGMSEAEAALRLRAARLVRAFPIALEMLGRSELNLTTLSLLAPLLTPDTLHLLEEARFKSKQRVLELIARHAPKLDVPDSIRRLPRPSVRAKHAQAAELPLLMTGDDQHMPDGAHDSAQLSPAPTAGSGPAILASGLGDARGPAQLSPLPTVGHGSASLAPAPEAKRSPVACALAVATRRSDTETPLSADRHRIVFTASQRVCDLIAQARHLRRHRYPTRDLERLFERALELLVADEQRRRLGRKTRLANTQTGEVPTARTVDCCADAPTMPTMSRTDGTRTTGTATRAKSAQTLLTMTDSDEPLTTREPTRSDDPGTTLEEPRSSMAPTPRAPARTDRPRAALVKTPPTRVPAHASDPRTALEAPRSGEAPATLNASRTEEARKTPNAAKSKPRSRHIPNAVRQQVWARDDGRCCFRGPDNSRCEARSPLEFHHVVPFARAGAHTADNIVLLCRAHNALLAERDYGREFVRARIKPLNHTTAAPHP